MIQLFFHPASAIIYPLYICAALVPRIKEQLHSGVDPGFKAYRERCSYQVYLCTESHSR